MATTDDKGRAATVFEADAAGARATGCTGCGPGAAPLDAAPSDQRPAVLHATDTVLENDLLRVELDPVTGWLTSLLDKRDRVSTWSRAPRGEHTQVCAGPDGHLGSPGGVVRVARGRRCAVTRVALREDGPLRARLRVEREWGRSTSSRSSCSVTAPTRSRCG